MLSLVFRSSRLTEQKRKEEEDESSAWTLGSDSVIPTGGLYSTDARRAESSHHQVLGVRRLLRLHFHFLLALAVLVVVVLVVLLQRCHADDQQTTSGS